jgi:hypothetical protein
VKQIEVKENYRTKRKTAGYMYSISLCKGLLLRVAEHVGRKVYWRLGKGTV